jgi:hypothetical protein
LTSSTVDVTALAILKRQASWGITIVSSQSPIMCEIQVIQCWPTLQTIHSKLAATDVESSKLHQDTWNRYLMIVFVSSQTAWNLISNLELRMSYKALRNNLVLPSGTILSNICQREYEPAMHAIQKELPSWNKVSLALDGWTTPNKLPITLVIAYYMDRNCIFCEIQLLFEEVYSMFLCAFGS